MKPRSSAKVAALSFAAFALCSPHHAPAASIVRSFGGDATAASITPARDQFRADLGGGTTAGANGSFGGLRREINWDGVPASLSAPNLLPANFFNVNSSRGVVFSTPGTGFQVSGATTDAGAGQPAAANFGDINFTYTTAFTTFTAQRLFTAVGANVTDVTFLIPGTTTNATVSGFGAVFTDVETLGGTKLQFFNPDNVSLGSFNVPVGTVGSQSLSFLGVSFDAGERISRVRITSGTAALGAGVNDNPGGGADLVVMDDFIYSEPVLVVARPPLNIQRSANTNVVLSWATNFTGFTLEANTNLNTNVWSVVSPAPAVSGTNNVVTNAVSGSARFYRLRQFTCSTGSITFVYSGAIVSFTVPACVTTIHIDAWGAEGGSGGSTTVSTVPGKGARMSGDFAVAGGTSLSVLVGEQGESRPPPSGYNGGGGGGSFVWQTANQTLLIAAGGGGGGGGLNNTITAEHNGVDAVTTTNGTNGRGLTSGGGVNGNGGTTPAYSPALSHNAAGGAGWLSNGNPGSSTPACTPFAGGGQRPLAGGAGGAAGPNGATLGRGGFGGGGGAQGICIAGGGGGGGGYSGGGGGASGNSGAAYKGGGGGGSYNGGTLQTNTPDAKVGNGSVTITW